MSTFIISKYMLLMKQNKSIVASRRKKNDFYFYSIFSVVFLSLLRFYLVLIRFVHNILTLYMHKDANETRMKEVEKATNKLCQKCLQVIKKCYICVCFKMWWKRRNKKNKIKNFLLLNFCLKIINKERLKIFFFLCKF